MAHALHALAVVARLHHVACDPASLLHHLGKPGHETAQPDDLLLVAKQIGLRARRVKTTTARLPLTPLPALALLQGGGIAVLAQCDEERVLLQRFAGKADPAPAAPQVQTLVSFS